MRIQQVSVTGLFGIFNHVIPLNINDRITIVHSPNGFGKTAMLRLLNGFFNSDYSAFETIPFRSFQILFDNDIHIEIYKELNGAEKTGKKNDINLNLNLYQDNSQKENFVLKLSNNYYIPAEDLLIASGGNNIAIHNIRGDIIIGGNLSSKSSESSRLSKSSRLKSQNEPEWLKNIKHDIHIRLVESQRLLNLTPGYNSNSEIASMFPTVSAYSDELAQIMRDKFSEYGTVSQSLDRTFPTRLVQRQFSPNSTDEQLRERLEQLEITRSRLISIGLLDKTENSDFPVQPPAMDESTKNILSVYVEDVEKKLNVFNDIANKIDLLRKIINSKFTYKEMSFNKRKGFVFRTLYDSSISDSDTLSPTDLSSGEQHELVLLYELLFKVEPKSLVLIDEPELSLHVGWQVQFIKDLQDIVKLADLDILMATHSPDIIQDRWDLTVELKGQEK